MISSGDTVGGRDQVVRTTVVASVVFFALFIFLGIAAVEGWTTPVDTSVMLAIHTWTSPQLTSAMLTITDGGTFLVVGPFCLVEAVIFYRSGQKVFAVALVLEVALEPLLANGFKLVFLRPRPTLFPHLALATGYAYPSGHAALATAGYGFSAVLVVPHVCGLARRVVVASMAAIAVALVALSRVYLGVHYPSDTIGSVLLVSSWMSIWVAILAIECRGNRNFRVLDVFRGERTQET